LRTPLILFGAIVIVIAVVVGLSSVGSGGAPTPSTAASAPIAVATASNGAGASAPAASPVATPTLLYPAPSDPLARTVAAGIEPAPKEYLVNHVHAHLDVFVDGKPIVVPAGIGINTKDPAVRSFSDPLGYGGIELCPQPCISPLHTHDESGIIHTESSDPKPHTLGQFFTEWGVELSETCVGGQCAPAKPIAVYVGGQPFQGDPRAIELIDRKVIVVVVGIPPAVIPSTADFSAA
jgi:hypothetical protein